MESENYVKELINIENDVQLKEEAINVSLLLDNGLTENDWCRISAWQESEV